jgi:hypothetical protein
MLDGIKLNDSTSFEEWAEIVIPWLNNVLSDVGVELPDDIYQLRERQKRNAGYLGLLAKILAKAEFYYKNALAEATEKVLQQYPDKVSLIKQIAAKEISFHCQVVDTLHRLNTTITDHQMTIANRINYDKEQMGMNGNWLNSNQFKALKKEIILGVIEALKDGVNCK